MSRMMELYRRSRDANPGGPSGITGQGERGQRGQVEGDLCTIDGWRGRLEMVNGELQCIPLQSVDSKPLITVCLDGASRIRVCAVTRRRFAVGANPKRACRDGPSFARRAHST